MNNLRDILDKAERYLRRTEAAYGAGFYVDATTVQQPELVVADSAAEEAAQALVTPTVERKKEVGQTVARNWQDAADLTVLYEYIHRCEECGLAAGRKNFVYGIGNPNAEVMCIGEAPGADEDDQGEPFVGKAGQLLTKILAAIRFRREDVYIANIIKCRPPGNRRPEGAEIERCIPYLHKQIALIQPKFILALGLTAVNALFEEQHRMGEIRGKALQFRGATAIATYHPSALLRNPEWKKKTWEDVQLLRRLYDEYKAAV